MQHHWFNELNFLNNDQLIDLENNVRNEFTARELHLNQNIHDLDDHIIFEGNNEG